MSGLKLNDIINIKNKLKHRSVKCNIHNIRYLEYEILKGCPLCELEIKITIIELLKLLLDTFKRILRKKR